MATPRFAWGIDIGNRALKAVKLVREADGLRVDDFDVIEHETVLSESGDNRDTLIQQSLNNFVQRHATRGGEVAIGVSGQSSFARFIKLPPVEKSKIPEIVKFEAIQQIPFPLDDVEWSYQLFQEPESTDVEVGIFAMRKDLVNRHLQFFTDATLDVGLIQMNPLAVYNAMYHDQRIKGTTMIIDLGAENTDLIIAEGESIWLRSIPIGGNNFTEALVKAFKMKFEKAEELKRNAATSKYGRQILQAMRPVFADLVAEIQRSIGFYASVHRDSKIQKVLALGGTFRLPGLQKYLQQNLQLDVQRIDSIAGGAPADARVAAMFSENLLSSVGAYGLALQAMNAGKIESSLLPMPIRRARMWREKTKWFGAAAAVLVLGLVGVPVARAFYDNYQLTRSTEAYDGQISQALREAQDLDSQWEAVANIGGPEREKITNINNLLKGRDLWPKLLKDIDSALPDPGPDVASGVPDRIKKVPRNQRKQMIVERFIPIYQSGLRTVLKMSDDELKNQVAQGAVYSDTSTGFNRGGFGFPGMYPGMYPGMMPGMMPGAMPGGGAPGMMPGAMPGMYPGMYPGMMPGMMPGGVAGEVDDSKTEGAKRRGFTITIKCTTPYAKYRELADEVKAKLLATAPDKYGPQGPYRIDRVIVPIADKIKKEDFLKTVGATRSLRPQRTMVPGQRLPGQPGFTGQPGQPGQGKDDKNPPRPVAPNARGNQGAEQQMEDLFVDPLTKESLKDDYAITLLAVVILDPEPEAKPADATGTAGGTVDATGTVPTTPGATPVATPTDAAQTASGTVPGVAPTAATPGAAGTVPGAAPTPAPSPAAPADATPTAPGQAPAQPPAPGQTPAPAPAPAPAGGAPSNGNTAGQAH